MFFSFLSHPSIPSQQQKQFDKELLIQRYNYCVIVAWVTLLYPVVILSVILSIINSLQDTVSFALLIPITIVFIASFLTIYLNSKIKNRTNHLKIKALIIKLYSLIFSTIIHFGSFLVWQKLGLNSPYLIGIFVYALIFYEPRKKISLPIYLLNFAIYILIIESTSHPLPNQIIAYISGVIATFGGLLIANLFYRTQVKEFLSRCQLESQREELHKLNIELNRLVGIDGLTHVANRRRFDEFLQQSCQELTIHKKYLALLLIDVDYFKFYNDTYGHQAGDDCLRNIAFAIQEEVRREGDLVARYGGEEFVVVLSHTSPEETLQVAKRLCDKVRSLNIPHESSSFGYVTISMGVVCQVPSCDETPEKLILKADNALYSAKHHGRNQFIMN